LSQLCFASYYLLRDKLEPGWFSSRILPIALSSISRIGAVSYLAGCWLLCATVY